MNWDAVGATGDIVGALAVVVSLVYVAIQIRQNTKATRQQSYHDLITRRSQVFFGKVAESRDVSKLWVAGGSGEALDEIDSQRFVSLMIDLMSHFQDVYLQHQSGVIEDHVWLAERRILAAVISAPVFVEFWEAISQYFLAEFIEEVAKVEPIDLVTYDQETNKWARATNAVMGKPGVK
jgi:hypothetical protein